MSWDIRQPLRKIFKEQKILKNLYRIILSDKLIKKYRCEWHVSPSQESKGHFPATLGISNKGNLLCEMIHRKWKGREAILVLNRPRDEWQPQATALPGQEKVVSSEPRNWALDRKLGPQGRCSHCWKIPPQSRGERTLWFKPSSHPNLLP